MAHVTLIQMLTSVNKKLVDLHYDLQERKENAESLSKKDSGMKDIQITQLFDKIHRIKERFEEIVTLTSQTSETTFLEDVCQGVSFKDKIMISLDNVLKETNSIVKQLKKKADNQRFERVYGEQKTFNKCEISDKVENIKREFSVMLDKIRGLIQELATTRDSGFDSFSEFTVDKEKYKIVTMEAVQCQYEAAIYGAEGGITASERLSELEICEKVAERCKTRRSSQAEPTEHDETGE